MVDSFENKVVLKYDLANNLVGHGLRKQFAETLAAGVQPSYTPEQLSQLGDQVLTVLDGDGDGHSRFSIVTDPGQSALASHDLARQTMRKLETQAGQSLNWLAVSSEKGDRIDIEIIASGTPGTGGSDHSGAALRTGGEHLVSAEADKVSPRVKLAGRPVDVESSEDCRKLLTDHLGLDASASQEEINHRLAARTRQLPDDTTAEELLEVLKRERLSNYFNERGLDSRGLTLEQMEQQASLNARNAITPDSTDVPVDSISDIMQGAESYYGLPPGSSADDLRRFMEGRYAAIAGLPANTPKKIVDQALDKLWGARRDRDEYLRGIGLSEQADMEASANSRRDRLIEAGYPAEMANTEEGVAILDSMARREQARRLGYPEGFDASVLPAESADGKAQDRKQLARLLGLPEDASSGELDRAAADTFGQCAPLVEDFASGRYIEFPGGE